MQASGCAMKSFVSTGVLSQEQLVMIFVSSKDVKRRLPRYGEVVFMLACHVVERRHANSMQSLPETDSFLLLLQAPLVAISHESCIGLTDVSVYE